LTGLEDLELAQRLVRQGGNVVYVQDAAVLHHHQESWFQIQRRFEREAIALRKIMPQIHVRFIDVLHYFISSTIKDWRSAMASGEFIRHAVSILRYRWHQYFGVYKGNNLHRRLSHEEKEKYFYPA
jgi:GT2 family glycosyltransferase